MVNTEEGIPVAVNQYEYYMNRGAAFKDWSLVEWACNVRHRPSIQRAPKSGVVTTKNKLYVGGMGWVVLGLGHCLPPRGAGRKNKTVFPFAPGFKLFRARTQVLRDIPMVPKIALGAPPK